MKILKFVLYLGLIIAAVFVVITQVPLATINENLIFMASLYKNSSTSREDTKHLPAVDVKTTVEPASQPALTVTTTSPSTVKWPMTLIATGGFYAWQEAVIAAETGGLRIMEVMADVGQVVKKGQVLARLAQETVQATLAQRRAEVAQAKSVVTQAKSDAQRALKAKGALSEQQAEQYFIAVGRTQAALEAMQAALRNEEIRLNKTQVVAVDDGTIASRSAVLGSVVQTGSELFRLIRQNRIEWRAEVTAEQLAQIKLKQKVNITLPGGKVVEGQVRLLSPTFDAKTRKGLIYVDLPTNSPARAGMFASGEFIISSKKGVTLPTSAVVLRDGFSYIFVVTEDNRVQQRKIITGRLKDDAVEILSPLEAKIAVVNSGGAFLEDGDKIEVTQSTKTVKP